MEEEFETGVYTLQLCHVLCENSGDRRILLMDTNIHKENGLWREVHLRLKRTRTQPTYLQHSWGGRGACPRPTPALRTSREED